MMYVHGTRVEGGYSMALSDLSKDRRIKNRSMKFHLNYDAAQWSTININSCGPLARNCRRTLLTQLTDRF